MSSDYINCQYCGEQYLSYRDPEEHINPDSATHLWKRLTESQRHAAASRGALDWDNTTVTPSDSASSRWGSDTWPCDGCGRPLSGDDPTWDAIPEGYRESQAMPCWCSACVPTSAKMLSWPAITLMLEMIAGRVHVDEKAEAAPFDRDAYEAEQAALRHPEPADLRNPSYKPAPAYPGVKRPMFLPASHGTLKGLKGKHYEQALQAAFEQTAALLASATDLLGTYRHYMDNQPTRYPRPDRELEHWVQIYQWHDTWKPIPNSVPAPLLITLCDVGLRALDSSTYTDAQRLVWDYVWSALATPNET